MTSKKIFALILALMMVFSLAACSSSTEPAAEPAEPAESGETEKEYELVITQFTDKYITVTYYVNGVAVSSDPERQAGDKTLRHLSAVEYPLHVFRNIGVREDVCPGKHLA